MMSAREGGARAGHADGAVLLDGLAVASPRDARRKLLELGPFPRPRGDPFFSANGTGSRFLLGPAAIPRYAGRPGSKQWSRDLAGAPRARDLGGVDGGVLESHSSKSVVLEMMAPPKTPRQQGGPSEPHKFRRTIIDETFRKPYRSARP
mmetsp:Transcript_57627/g.182532  ORF Transcript_57627/g.182532 Transcript_57627/m.182532 type:complete len:149 (+) Transcript_57627:58-504(+)